MKLITTFLFLLSGCSPSLQGTKQFYDLTGHEWICDSITTTLDSVRNSVKAGKGLAIEFDQSGIYKVFKTTVTANNYFVSHDSIYFWEPGKQMRKESFFIIKDLTDRNLHIWERDTLSRKEFDEYYHYQ